MDGGVEQVAFSARSQLCPVAPAARRETMWTRTPLDEALAWMGVGAALVGLALLIPDGRLKERSADSLRATVQVAGQANESEPTTRYRAIYTDLSNGRTRVDLYDDQAGRKLWSVTTGRIHRRAWSQDGRAFALVAQPLSAGRHGWHSRLLLWREGGRPTWHHTIRPLEQFLFTTGLKWSPDKRWLLILGEPWVCVPIPDTAWALDTVELRPWFLSHDVEHAEWAGRDRIRIRTINWIKETSGRWQERKSVSEFDVRSRPQPDPDE